jgi:type I restriction enzyme S subunit
MVPEGWSLVEAKEVCKSISVGVVIKPTQYYVDESKGVKAFRSANVREGFINDSEWVYFSQEGHAANKKSHLKSGDVLVVRTGYPGTACVVTPDFEGANAIDIVIARPDVNRITPDYLCAYTNSHQGKSQVLDLQGGMAQKHLNVGAYQVLKIKLPPLSEQKKIAQILSAWDKAITTTEKLLANSQQQKKALMQQLLTGKKRLLDDNGERFSGEWKWLKVSDLLKVRKDKQVPTENVPLFSLTIEDGITPKSDRYNREFLVKNIDQKKYKVVKPKDIVYNPANLRWGAINFSRFDHAVVVSPIYEVLFLKDENKNSLEFIAKKLMAPDQIGRFAAMIEGTLVERMAVKIEPFLATKLSVPPTLDEQQKIAAVLSTADQDISALQEKIHALKQEKKSLMQQLLTGKRRVKVQ